MAKRKTKAGSNGNPVDAADRLQTALTKQTKPELVSVLLELAHDDKKILRQLMTRFDVAVASDELVAATRRAIADATDFDEREINQNFDYDYEAYEEVKRNFTRMVEAGDLREAMQLALELMKEGSYQVEMSDEGMMTDDIEGCLEVVLKAVQLSDLPADEVVAWCLALLASDRTGFIMEKPIKALRNRFEAVKG